MLETSRAQLEQGKQRFDAGSISKKDLLQFESQTAGDEYNLVNAENNYKQNINALKQILQLPTNFNFQVATPDIVTVKEISPSLEQAQQTALTERPEIKNSSLNIDIAKQI